MPHHQTRPRAAAPWPSPEAGWLGLQGTGRWGSDGAQVGSRSTGTTETPTAQAGGPRPWGPKAEYISPICAESRAPSGGWLHTVFTEAGTGGGGEPAAGPGQAHGSRVPWCPGGIPDLEPLASPAPRT